MKSKLTHDEFYSDLLKLFVPAMFSDYYESLPTLSNLNFLKTDIKLKVFQRPKDKE